MSTPVASAIGFHLAGGTEQTILGGVGAYVKVPDDGFIIVRNIGGVNPAVINVYTSCDGVNFQQIPDTTFAGGVPAATNPQPYPLPSPRARGEFIRVTGSSTDTVVDVEIYWGGSYPAILGRHVVKR